MLSLHVRISALFVTLSLVLVGAAPGDQQKHDVFVGPRSTARSILLHLQPNEGIAVTGSTNDPQFAIDLYIYNSEKILVAKDDEDSNSASFQWQTSIEGDYYVVARNLSPASGSINITITRDKGLPGTSTPTYAEMRIFYATDRNVTGQRRPTQTYGSEPDPQGRLHLGECIVSIPRDHRMGELEGPSIFRLEIHEDPEKHVVLERVDEESRSNFQTRIAKRTSNSQHKEIFVFVHGFNTTFADATRRTAQMAYDLGFDGPAVAYSWPSQGTIGPIAYNMDSRNADLTVSHLQDFLKLILRESGATTIHLVAHSMGNRPLTSALRQAAISQEGSNFPVFNQVVLMAPDIDAAQFKLISQQIRPSAKRITLYASSKDEALKLSSTYAGYPRAGQGGPQILVLPGIDTIDASSVDTSALGFFHQYYADNSTLLSDLFHVLQGDAADRRFGLQREQTRAGIYWEFRVAAR